MVNWYRVPEIDMAEAARLAGFDLAVFDGYSKKVQTEIRAKVAIQARKYISSCLEEGDAQKSLNDFENAVYVISLGKQLALKYKKNWSTVLYIGEGHAIGRLESHLRSILFDVMLSLNGASFSFMISEPRQPNAADYYKHIEWALLDKFSKDIGGGELPILNNQKGSYRGEYTLQPGWNSPLKNSGKNPRWLVHPTSKNEFKPLDE